MTVRLISLCSIFVVPVLPGGIAYRWRPKSIVRPVELIRFGEESGGGKRVVTALPINKFGEIEIFICFPMSEFAIRKKSIN